MSGTDFDFSEFLDFANKFHKTLQEENFILGVMDHLGDVMLRDVKANTPVGQYDNTVFFTGTNIAGGRFIAAFEGPKTTRKGGTLRRNWEVISVTKQGDTYVVGIGNNTEYADYVEYGHRKSDHSGWVEGQFFLKMTMEDIEAQLPKIVGPKYQEYLKTFGFG